MMSSLLIKQGMDSVKKEDRRKDRRKTTITEQIFITVSFVNDCGSVEVNVVLC